MSDDRIFHCVARVGAMGWLGSFGSIHPISADMRNPIVVQSTLGTFLATVSPNNEITSAAPERPRVPLVGEVLREADANDIAVTARNRSWVEEHFEHISQSVKEVCESIAIIDCDVTLERSGLIIWFIGQSTSALGPLTVQIANRWHFESVQFMSEEQVRQWSLTELEPTSTANTLPTAIQQASHRTHDNTIDWHLIEWEKQQATARFSKPSSLALQSHGIYQQKRRHSASTLHNWPTEQTLMLRIRHHGIGWKLATISRLLTLAARYGDGWLRPTVRQGWQIYGITKNKVQTVVQQLDSLFLTSHGACGNYVRNISVCPLAHLATGVERLAYELTLHLEQLLRPKNDSYELVWLTEGDNDKSLAAINDDRLPHKLKIGVSTSNHCCNEPLSNDLAIILADSDDREGSLPYVAHIFLGGGLGFRTNDSLTAPRLAAYSVTIPAFDVIPFASGLIEAYRKHAPRRQRKLSRLKYWLAEIGVEELLRLIQQEAPRSFKRLDPQSITIPPTLSHRGKHKALDKTFYGVSWQQCGLNANDSLLEDWFRSVELSSDHSWYLTSQQEVILGPNKNNEIDYLDRLYTRNIWERYWLLNSNETALGAKHTHQQLPTVTACPALPTCGLALSDAEIHRRSMQTFLENIAHSMAVNLGAFQFRISGCSNNCSRPMLAHLALIAHTPQRYGVYLGGSHSQQRLAQFTGKEFTWGDELFAYMETVLKQLCLHLPSIGSSMQPTIATLIDSLPPSTLRSLA